MDVQFIEDGHRYIDVARGGIERLSVTTIIQGSAMCETRWFTDGDKVRGREVHEKTRELDETGQATIAPQWAGFLDGYRAYLDIMRPQWHYLEHIIHDPLLGYAGRLDRAGIVDGIKFVVDIKTGSLPPTVGIQVAAYRRCLPEPHTWQRAALQLTADGKFRWTVLHDPDDEKVFLAALMVETWKRRHRA